MDEPEFDFGTETALESALSQSGIVVASEPTSPSRKVLTAASAGSEVELPPSTWREVPAALFLSWSDARQRSYCAARDRDSALYAESDVWTQFYLTRARMYEQTV